MSNIETSNIGVLFGPAARPDYWMRTEKQRQGIRKEDAAVRRICKCGLEDKLNIYNRSLMLICKYTECRNVCDGQKV